MRPLLFAYSLLFLGILPLIGAQTCQSCATPSLKLNWELTGLPAYPKTNPNNTKFFELSDCANDVQGDRGNQVNCPSASCFFGTYALQTGEYAVVRACLDDLLGNSGISAGGGNGQCEMAQVENPVTISGEVVTKPYVGWAVCTKDPNCNDLQASLKVAKEGLKFIPNTETQCSPPKNKGQCIACSHVDGHGRCHRHSKTYCTGAYCTKLTGKLNGRWFEIRNCANVNPLAVSTCLVREKTYTIQEVGGVINQTYWSNSCICEGEKCNGASSMSVFSLISMAATGFVLKFFFS